MALSLTAQMTSQPSTSYLLRTGQEDAVKTVWCKKSKKKKEHEDKPVLSYTVSIYLH